MLGAAGGAPTPPENEPQEAIPPFKDSETISSGFWGNEMTGQELWLVNNGAKWGDGGGVKRGHLAAASLSTESTGVPRVRRGVLSTG